MSSSYVSVALRKSIEDRARLRCEYCQTQQLIIGMPLEIEHIIPTANGGITEETNLCLACPRCNRYKSIQTAAIDPETGRKVALFHPRQQSWHEHFIWQDKGVRLVGLTSTGRATITALQMNNDFVVRARKLWIEQNWHPPE